MEPVISQIEKTIFGLPISYNGNKKPIFRWIAEHLCREAADCETVLDGFSGTGIISALLSGIGKTVYACDALQTAYCMSVTLAQNPGLLLSKQELEMLTSHRVVDGRVFEDEEECDDGSDIYAQFRGSLTRNECGWLKRAATKIKRLQPYQQMIGYAAIKGVCSLQPYGTPNGRATYKHRWKQKDQYGDRCLGHYLNSSYEVEIERWFKEYCYKFNAAAKTFSGLRDGQTYCYRTDIIAALNLWPWLAEVDMAYFDPPYGQRQRGYAVDYGVSEVLMGSKGKDYNDFDTPAGHRVNFERLLILSYHIPKIIFSYDDKSWESIDHIVQELERFGRTVRIETCPHKHGKDANKQCSRQVNEHLLIAEKR